MASIGLIVPTTNTVNEAEWKRMALHAHGDESLHADLRTAIDTLKPQRPDVIAYACTAGSMVQPLDSLGQFIERAAGIKGVATAPALVHACRGIGAGGPHEYVQIARVPAEQVYEHCRSVDVPYADGMVISCTDFRTLEAIPRLEAELGKPVISPNTATLWHALRSAGVEQRFKGFGRLLEDH